MKVFMKKFFSVKTVALTLVLLFVAVGITCLVMLSGWKEYRNDEFGFSFRYPGNWYFGGTEITEKQLKNKGVVFFWVDPKSEDQIRHGEDTDRSPGNVEVWIEDNSSTFEAHKSQNDFSKLAQIRYGKFLGYTGDWVDCGGVEKNYCVAHKSFDLKADKYYFYVNTLSETANANVYSTVKSYSLSEKLYMYFYYRIGSVIVESFRFY